MPLHVRDLGSGPPGGDAPSRPRPRRLGVPSAAPRRWSTPASVCCSSTCRAAVARRAIEWTFSRPRARGRGARPRARVSRTGHCSGTRAAATWRCSTWSTSRAAPRAWSRPTPTPRRRSRRRAGGPVRGASPRRSPTACTPRSSARTPDGRDARRVPRAVARPDAVLRRRPGGRRADARRTCSSRSRRTTSHDCGELHALDALAAADIPVLAIAGEHDRPTPPACARRIASTAPRGELLIVEGAGHFPFAEQPDRYWPALIDWLTRTSS